MPVYPSTGCSRSLEGLPPRTNGHWYVVPLLLAAATIGCASLESRSEEGYAPAVGDLMFQQAGDGTASDAIVAVTEGVDGAQLTHVGMVTHAEGNDVRVIEARSDGVQEVSLAAFLARSADASGLPRVIVGRLRSPYASLIPGAVEAARERLGAPYDKAFSLGDDAYYCAELLYVAFREANRGVDVFAPEPMTFNDAATGLPHPGWVAYYEELGVPIPEGEPGLNPGAMSRAPMVSIVHAYGRPAGWRGRAAE